MTSNMRAQVSSSNQSNGKPRATPLHEGVKLGRPTAFTKFELKCDSSTLYQLLNGMRSNSLRRASSLSAVWIHHQMLWYHLQQMNEETDLASMLSMHFQTPTSNNRRRGCWVTMLNEAAASCKQDQHVHMRG